MKQLAKADELMKILPIKYLGWDVYEAAIDYIAKLQNLRPAVAHSIEKYRPCLEKLADESGAASVSTPTTPKNELPEKIVGAQREWFSSDTRKGEVSAPAPTPTQPDYKALCEMAARILLQHMNDEDYEMSLAGLYSALTEHTLVASEVQPTPTNFVSHDSLNGPSCNLCRAVMQVKAYRCESCGNETGCSEVQPTPTHQGDWIWEDELPKGYPYKQMFEHSKLGPDGRGGCRIFPKLPLKLGVEVQPTDERAEQDRQFKEARELVNSYEDRHKHLHGYYSRTDLLTVARLAARVLSGPKEKHDR